MPVVNYTGGGSFYRAMTRNIGPASDDHHRGEQAFPRRDVRPVTEVRERALDSYLADDGNSPSFRRQLSKMGLQLRDIPADGNCLFRALGDQLEGHCRNHYRHRTEVVHFMKSHRTDFEPFVEDDMSFDDHVRALQKLGTHAGNDAIVAFAKLHGVCIVIHQLNGKPLMIQGMSTNNENTRQLHLAYHNGDHYSSIRKLDDNTESPANICMKDLETELNHHHHHSKPSSQSIVGGVVSAQRKLEDIESEVAFATNCMDMQRVRQVLVECDYDVDASIADLLQQLELNNHTVQDDSTSLASQTTCTTDSGVWNMSAANSSRCSPSSDRGGEVVNSVLKTNGHSCANGKGHKVHFREDSVGGSSLGYGSLSSYNGLGARPKVVPVQQMPHKRTKESKKMDKKRLAQERGRQEKTLFHHHHYIPQATDVRDVAVVTMHNGRLTRI